MSIKSALKQRYSLQLLVVMAVFAVLGGFLILSSKAATTSVAAEAEKGVINGNAAVVASSGAAGESAVRFASGSVPVNGTPVFGFRMFGGDDNPARIGTANMTKYKVYMLSPYMVQTARAIKQQNPSALTYMYKDPTSTRNTADCVANAIGRDWGVDYCDTTQNHSNWFMTKNGQRFEYSGYAGHWHVDVGASGYKERYVSNVLEDLRKNNVWNGVFMDNIMADITAYAGGSYPDQYRTQDAGRNAYAAFTQYVGTQLSAAGFGSMGNNNGARLTQGLWAKYTAGTSGAYDEFWTTFGDSNLPAYDGIGWDAQMTELDLMSQQGKLGVFTAQTNGGSCKACQRYGYASYLLGADGRQVYVEGNVDGDVGNWISYSPMYSWNLGAPTAARSQPETNLFQRSFVKGLVLVNADANMTRKITLPQAYLDESGASITTVTLGPTSGVVLRLP